MYEKGTEEVKRLTTYIFLTISSNKILITTINMKGVVLIHSQTLFSVILFSEDFYNLIVFPIVTPFNLSEQKVQNLKLFMDVLITAANKVKYNGNFLN